jgi:Histidine phosphatase superfamily (branch 2)
LSASHSGINRKLQLKPQAWEPIATAAEVIDAAITADTTAAGTATAGATAGTTAAVTTTATADTTAAAAAGDAAAADKPAVPERATELELILKWGGELTKLGERQAMELGDTFRK